MHPPVVAAHPRLLPGHLRGKICFEDPVIFLLVPTVALEAEMSGLPGPLSRWVQKMVLELVRHVHPKVSQWTVGACFQSSAEGLICVDFLQSNLSSMVSLSVTSLQEPKRDPAQVIFEQTWGLLWKSDSPATHLAVTCVRCPTHTKVLSLASQTLPPNALPATTISMCGADLRVPGTGLTS